MSRVMGANVRLYMKPETTYGTNATGNYTQLAFMTAELGAEQGLIDNRIIGLGNNRDPGDPFLDVVNTAGQAEVPINEDGFGHWLRLLFGAPNTTGSAPNFVHAFDSGAAALPSNTISLDYTSTLTNRYGVNAGVRADTLDIDFSPSGPAMARIGLIAQGETRQASAVHGSPTAAAGANFSRHMGSISRNGSPLAQVTAAQLRFSNGLEAVRTIRADRKIEGADPSLTAATGTVTLRLSAAAETLLADAIASTPFELDLRLERSAARYLNFNLPRVFLSAPRSPVRGPQGIETAFNFQAVFDATDTRMMRVTLANSVASYA